VAKALHERATAQGVIFRGALDSITAHHRGEAVVDRLGGAASADHIEGFNHITLVAIIQRAGGLIEEQKHGTT